ncbi:MAG: hypothetical protein RL885_27880 [Planctomycetota bacterium]
MSSGEANRTWSSIRWAVIAVLAVGLLVVYFTPFGGGAPQSEEDLLARLRERATGLWEARVKSDWDKTYEYHFPPKADEKEERMSRTSWLQGKGSIVYHKFEVEDVHLTSENEAEVTVSYQWEMVNPIIQTKLKGRVIEEANHVTHPWRFRQGDWYREVQSLADRIQNSKRRAASHVQGGNLGGGEEKPR